MQNENYLVSFGDYSGVLSGHSTPSKAGLLGQGGQELKPEFGFVASEGALTCACVR